MKPGWTTVALGEVAEVVRRTVSPADMQAEERYLGLEHIERGGRILGGMTVGEAGPRSNKFRFDAGQILYGKLRPNLGKIARPKFSGLCSTDILPLRVNEDVASPEFVLHFLSQPDVINHVASRATGANLPRISAVEFKKVGVPLPSLEEQRRIAAILDVAKRVIASMGKSAVAEGAVLDSALGTLIGNSTATVALGDQLEFLTSGPRGWGKFTTPDGFPFIRIQNVGRGRIELDGLARVTPPEGAEERRVRVQRDDVLLSITADLGRAGIVRDELIDGYISQHLAILRTRSLDPHFLAAFLESPEGVRQMRGANRGQTKDGLNFDAIRGLRIPIISTEKQSEFRRFCEQVEELRVRRSARQHRARGLFASLQSRAFQGEL